MSIQRRELELETFHLFMLKGKILTTKLFDKKKKIVA
jgi:hypothetical protein